MKFALLPALVCVAACSSRERLDPSSGSARLMHDLLRAEAVEVYAGPGLATEPLRRSASLRTRELDGYALRLSTGDERLPRVVLGSFGDPLATRLVERLGLLAGIQAGQPWFSIAGTEFDSPEDALVACFEDPERPGLPLTVYYANDDEHLARLAAHELAAGWQPSFCVWSAGRGVLRGPLALDGRIDPERLVRTPPTPDLEAFAPRPDHIGGRAQKGIDAPSLASALARIALGRAALCAWAAPQAELPPIELVVYARPEDFVGVARSAEAAALEPLSRRVHLCVSGQAPAEGAAAAARAAGRKLLGECAAPWLEDGAAVDAAGSWWGEPLEAWLDWIAVRGLALPLERVLDPRADESVSPHLLLPLRAALFRLVRETRGDAELRALWSGAHVLATDAALAQAFETSLAARAAAAQPGLATRRGPGFPGLDASGRETWRGVEGEPGTRNLGSAQELGANACGLRIAMVARQDPLALPDPFHPRRMGTREGDLEVWAALTAARARGMATFVDVDLLATPSGVEDGVWLRARPAQWERFFAARSAALVHAGLLAQLGHADALSIGCDLSSVTRDQIEGRKGKQEDLDRKRTGWAEVIARTRSAYEGALVYVASPVDLPLVLFWKDLDAIGYRLEGPPGELAQVAAVASAQNKPWFLARTPYTTELGGALLELPQSARPSASFFWRWPADPEEQPLDARDVLLSSPETLEALRDLWRKL